MSFIGALKNFVGFGTDEDYDEEDYYEDEDLEEESRKTQTFKRPSRVVPIGSGHGNSKIKIIKPMSFDDSIKVADEIKERRLVIFDVGNMDGDEARRVVDLPERFTDSAETYAVYRAVFLWRHRAILILQAIIYRHRQKTLLTGICNM